MLSTRSLRSALFALAVVAAPGLAHSDLVTKPSVSMRKPPAGVVVAKPDKVGISKLQVSAEPGVKTVTLEIKNNSKDSALWMGWRLELAVGGGKKFLGAGSIDSLNGGQSKTLTFQFLPPDGQSSLEASIDIENKVETDAAMRWNNVKSLSVSGGPVPATLSAQELAAAAAASAGATHEYAPRVGMTGCSMTQSEQGATVTLDFACTAPGAGELTLWKGLTLKNGFKVNAISVGSLGGGLVHPRFVPSAGSTTPATQISVQGGPGNAPVVFGRVEVVGPAGQSPF